MKGIYLGTILITSQTLHGWWISRGWICDDAIGPHHRHGYWPAHVKKEFGQTWWVEDASWPMLPEIDGYEFHV
jgi:hypothetical protein